MKLVMHVNFILLLLLLLGVHQFESFAQTSGWLWAQSEGGIREDQGNSICSDAYGDVIVVGNFNSPTIIFGSTTLVNADSASYADHVFIVKYDPAGNVLWSQSAGEGPYRNFITSVCCDFNGNIIATGYFQNATITFGSTTLTHDSGGGDNIFIVKFDPSGTVLWAMSAGYSTWGNHRAYGVCTDVTGNIIVTGNFFEHITFGAFSLSNLDTNNASQDVFIAKLDSSGNVIWAKSAGDTGNNTEGSQSITTDPAGNIFIAGYFWGEDIIFDSDTLHNQYAASSTTDIFLTKYNSAGNVVWARSAEGNFVDYANAVAADSDGNAYMTGVFSSYDIYFGNIALQNGNTTFDNDFFLVKYDSSGNPLWAYTPPGSYDSGNDICVDAAGDLYVTGFRNGEMFITKFDSSSTELWTINGGSQQNCNSRSICIDPMNRLTVTGSFEFPYCDFDSIRITNSSGFTSTMELFIARVSQCDFTSDTLIESSCDSAVVNTQTYFATGMHNQLLTNAAGCDSLLTIALTINHSSADSLSLAGCDSINVNGLTYYTSGIYSQILSSSAGCDSVLTLDLSINSIDVSTSLIDTIVIANMAGATYQWINCNSGYSIIPGETNQSFAASVNGNYAVEITYNGCTDTSACVSIFTVDGDHLANDRQQEIYIFPNPVQERVMVRLSNIDMGVSVIIYDLLGNVILQSYLMPAENSKGSILVLDTSQLSQGSYWIEVKNKNGICRSFIQKL